MSLRINHNIASINGHRNMLKNDMAISKSLEKLSSGLRINRAADDAAGLVISEQMRAQITGLNQAIDNSETAISMVQTAEGALDEVNSLLNKARELVLHAANEGANDTNQLQADQAELDNVIASITRIGDFTQFGTKKLLDGSLAGVESQDAGINRVKVGNLANNAAVSNTTMNLNVTALVKEATVLTGADANDAGVVFDSAVTELDLTGGQKLRSGAHATLTVSGVGSYTFTASTGGADAAAIAADFNSQIGTGYNVTYDTTSKGFKVENASFGATTDITASVSFTITGNGGGTVEAVKASVGLPVGATGTAATAANAFLATGGSSLSGLSTSTVLDSGTVFDLTVSTSTGSFTATYTTSGADTIGDVIADLQSDLQGNGIIGAGATVSFADDSAGGFSLTVARSGAATATDLTDFNVAVNIDNPNAVGGSIEAHSVALATTGTFYSTTGAVTGASVAAGNVGFYLDVNGISVQHITDSTGQSLANVAAALQAELSGAGFVGFRVEVVTGGTNVSGLSQVGTGDPGVTGAGSLGAGVRFAIYTTGAGADAISSMTLSMDSASVTGLDYTDTASSVVTGSAVDATLNLVSTASSRTSGVVSIADTTISSDTSTIISGTTNPTVSLDYGGASGLTLSVTKTLADGSLALSLSTGVSANDGFEDVEIEITEAAAQAGGTFSFTIDNGALFQVGANGGQNVGVTIAEVSAVELGRNVSGSGPLESLDDLTTSNQGALLNGYTDEALEVIDKAIDEVTNLRGDLGAFQANTLETGLNSLRVSQENLTAAESTIRDVDFAAESAQFTRNNILIQASTAMLAQANQLPQNVLQLLG